MRRIFAFLMIAFALSTTVIFGASTKSVDAAGLIASPFTITITEGQLNSYILRVFASTDFDTPNGRITSLHYEIQEGRIAFIGTITYPGQSGIQFVTDYLPGISNGQIVWSYDTMQYNGVAVPVPGLGNPTESINRLLQVYAAPNDLHNYQPTSITLTNHVITIAYVAISPISQPMPASTPSTGCTVITLDQVNLRAMPDIKSRVIAIIPIKTTLAAIDTTSQKFWIGAVYNGNQGWVSTRYVSKSKACPR